MLYGARWTLVTACDTSFKTQTRHATSTCMSHISQGVSRFRYGSQRLCPTAPPQSTYRSRTLSCTGMPSLYPSSSPGAFTKYSFTTCEYLFAHVYQVYRKHTFRRVGPPKDISRMYAVCLVGHSTQVTYIDELFHSIFSPFWSAFSCPFSSWSTQWRSGSINFFMVS